MIVEVNDNKTVGEIRDAFVSAFPFLRIEFFRQPHEWGKPSPLGRRMERDVRFGSLRTLPGNIAIEIHSWHTTGAIEQAFGKIFGVHIQVFRREAMDWVQTAATDDRTLEEQNQAGRNMTQELMDGTDKRFTSANDD